MAFYIVDFGTAYTSLSTVGVTELNGAGAVVVPRTTVGVINLGQGAYGIELIVNVSTKVVRWDTGTTIPLYAVEEIASSSGGADPATIANAVWTSPLALTVAKFLGLK